MTHYEELMATATPNWLAFLLSNTWGCIKCPCNDGCPMDSSFNCVRKIKEWLESEADNE
jgi:hypothetical protein